MLFRSKQLLLLRLRMSLKNSFSLPWGRYWGCNRVGTPPDVTKVCHLNDFVRSFNLKCSQQTSVSVAIVYSLPSSQRIPWIHYFPLDANIGQFLSLPVAFKDTKTSRHSEIKQTRPSTKQDFSGEALSKQNTEASLASLSCNSSRAFSEWSAIFAFSV